MDTIIDAVRYYLACPQCHSQLTVDQNKIFCQTCDFTGQIFDGVVTTMDYSHPTYFDQPFEILQEDKKNEKFWQLSHQRQGNILTLFLKSGVVVLDVGCGRSLQYQKPTGCFVIGLDSSFLSIRAKGMDVGCMGEGEETFLELMRDYLEFGDFCSVGLSRSNGIVYHDGGTLERTL